VPSPQSYALLRGEDHWWYHSAVASEKTPRRRVRRAARAAPPRPNREAVVKVVSLRDHVRGAVVEFLEHARMSCLKTQEGLVTIINSLAHYTEEGKVLFPEVFVFDDVGLILKMLGPAEGVAVGVGAKEPGTMAAALKRCAPLARGGWAVYIERRQDVFGYGLLRCGTSALSLSAAEILVDKADAQCPVLVLRQVGRNLIELKSSSQSNLLIHFGATKEGEISAAPLIDGFIEALTDDVPTDIQELTASFYRKVLIEVLRAEHGTLAAVLRGRRKAIPSRFREGVPLALPVSIPDRIRELALKTDSESQIRLEACGTMIVGMLLSDGITLFGSDGTVRAYNIFIKHPRAKGASGTPSGGARSRTFDIMASVVGTTLTAAFMHSQDGHVEFRRA